MLERAARNDDDEIVYIDSQGFIRALDPNQSSGQPLVTWVSPTGGWRSVALGDFNADGDDEIVAISLDESGNRLIIYDPVVASGPVDPDNNFSGNYWTTLYQTTLPGAATAGGHRKLRQSRSCRRNRGRVRRCRQNRTSGASRSSSILRPSPRGAPGAS